MKKVDKDMRAIGMVELGAASRLTRGMFYFLPYFEVGVPPYVYACPFC